MWVNWCDRAGRDSVCCVNSEKYSIVDVFWCVVGRMEDCVTYGLELDFVPVPYHGVWFHCAAKESVTTVYHVCICHLYIQMRCVGSM